VKPHLLSTFFKIYTERLWQRIYCVYTDWFSLVFVWHHWVPLLLTCSWFNDAFSSWDCSTLDCTRL